MKKIRLDELLVQREFFDTAEQSLRAVLAHEVKVGDEYATSAAQLVTADADITVKDAGSFVSRGGIKLQGALDYLNLDIASMKCIDIGCSTGGFTDCLLQAGAKEVVAVDVGYGDLAWKLRTDPRVHLFERTNIRSADPAELGAPFDLITADLSFIGLASLAPVFAALSQTGTIFLGLVKPQFESQAGETDKRGFIADPTVRARTVAEVEEALVSHGFTVNDVVESPIKGRKSHNIEYVVYATFS